MDKSTPSRDVAAQPAVEAPIAPPATPLSPSLPPPPSSHRTSLASAPTGSPAFANAVLERNGIPTKSPPIRSRQTKACTVCRAAKIRCDGAINPPCAVECVFVESRRGKQGPHIRPLPPVSTGWPTSSSRATLADVGAPGVNSDLLRWILDTYKPTPSPLPHSFTRVDRMHLDALASYGFVQLSTFLTAINLCFGVESADGHGNRSTAVHLAPPGDPSGAIVTGVQRVSARNPPSPPLHPLPLPPPPPPPPHILAPVPVPVPLGTGPPTTDQDMDELDSQSDSSHFDDLDDLDAAAATTPSSLLGPSNGIPHHPAHRHSQSLRTLSLDAFIEHMKNVDPPRAQLYDDTKAVLEAEAIGSDVLARVGLVVLVRIGVKIGVASRMMLELEG